MKLTKTRSVAANSFTATVFIAGSLDQAKQYLRRLCFEVGLCVTVEPTLYIYTGGEESGVRIGLVNYPRFPSTPRDITAKAVRIASELMQELFQTSALVIAGPKTIWLTRRGDK